MRQRLREAQIRNFEDVGEEKQFLSICDANDEAVELSSSSPEIRHRDDEAEDAGRFGEEYKKWEHCKSANHLDEYYPDSYELEVSPYRSYRGDLASSATGQRYI